MSQATDLLNSLSTTSVTVSTEPVDDFLLVDPETRTINVPRTETLFGVVGDKNVERKYFKCPRYVGDDIDLSTLGIRINYRTSSGYSDKYPVDDVEIVGDYITFSWLINSNAFLTDGVIYFIICAVKVDSDGNEINHWNTTPATGNVLIGLEVEDLTYEEEYQARDVLQQLLDMLDTKSAEAVQNVEDTTAEQTAIIEAKGAETLATIPEDYTETYNMAKEALAVKADKIVSNVSGEALVMTDSSGMAMEGLKVYGKSTQVSTTGKNMFDISKITDGVGLTATGELETIELCTSDFIPVLPNTSYYVSATQSHRGKFYDADQLPISDVFDFRPSLGTNFVTTDNTFYVRLSANRSITEIQLELGDTATEYEPYSGGYASPCPDWPQAITSLGEDGDLAAGLLGRNLIDISSLTVSTNKTLEVSEDGYTITLTGGTDHGWCSSNYEFPTELVKMLRGKKIYTSCDSYTSEQDDAGTRAGFNVTLEDGTAEYPASIGLTKTSVSETISEKAARIIFAIYTNNSGVNLETDNTVVVKGLRVSIGGHGTWEESKGFQSISLPYSLRAIPVTDETIANYTDSDGQMWVADYVDEENQQIVHRIYEGVVKDFNWILERVDDTFYEYKTYSSDIEFVNGKLVSTHFAYKNDNRLVVGSTKNIYARFPISTGIDTEDKANEFFADNEVTYYGILLEPTYTDLTTEEIEAFKALHTNYPNTTVLNTENAFMELKYNADTKTYIKQNGVDSKPVDHVLLTDTSTGKIYQLTITNGAITTTEVS